MYTARFLYVNPLGIIKPFVFLLYMINDVVPFSFQTSTNVSSFPDAAKMEHASTLGAPTAVLVTKGSWPQAIKMFVKVTVISLSFYVLHRTLG